MTLAIPVPSRTLAIVRDEGVIKAYVVDLHQQILEYFSTLTIIYINEINNVRLHGLTSNSRSIARSGARTRSGAGLCGAAGLRIA